MKQHTIKLLCFLSITLSTLLPVSGQQISDILNALQERNDKVEDLREKELEEWSDLYADWLNISPVTSPGQGDVNASFDSIQADAEVSEVNNFLKEMSLVVGRPRSMRIDIYGDGDVYLEDYDVPAYRLYMNFEETCKENGAPEMPSEEEIQSEDFELNKWAYDLTVWAGGNAQGLSYTKKRIKWVALGNSETASEARIEALSQSELQELLIELSFHFDRLKTEFVNVESDLVGEGDISQIVNYNELTMPSFGVIQVSDLAYVSRAINQLHTLHHPITVESGRFQDVKNRDNFDVVDILDDEYYYYSPFPFERRLFQYDGLDPEYNVTRNYQFAGVERIVETDLNDFAFPVWQVNNIDGGSVSVYSRIRSRLTRADGWQLETYTSHAGAGERNARPRLGGKGVSDTVALWKPDFTDTALDTWEDIVVQTPLLGGEWVIPTTGHHGFVLDLSQGADRRSHGQLVLSRTTLGTDVDAYVDLAHSNSLEFIGSKEDFTFEYNNTVFENAVDWNKSRLTSVEGEIIKVEISYPKLFEMELKIYRRDEHISTVTINSGTSLTSRSAVLDAAMPSWSIKEDFKKTTLRPARTCTLERLNEENKSWQVTTTAGGKESSRRSSHTGAGYTHVVTDFDGTSNTIMDPDFAPSVATESVWNPDPEDRRPWDEPRRLSSSNTLSGISSTYEYHEYTFDETLLSNRDKSKELYPLFALSSSAVTTEGQYTTTRTWDKSLRATRIDRPGDNDVNIGHSQ